MHTRHVPAGDWRKALDDLSRSYDGVIITLEIMGNTLGTEREVSDQPLRGITSDRSGVTIQVGNVGGLHLDHRVAQPKEIRIIENDEGVILAVEIEDQEGTYSLVRFRSPLRPEVLDRGTE